MSANILDQLYSVAESPEKAPAAIQSMFNSALVTAFTAMGAHQTMSGGFKQGSYSNEPLTRPRENTSGTIDVAQSLQVARDYQRLLQAYFMNNQVEDLRFSDTADDVFDGGIKKGSKVLIRVVPEETRLNRQSWGEVARRALEGSPGKARPENLIFDKFSVNSVSEPDQERFQIVETFGADLIYSFGRRPRRIQMNGQVLNGKMEVSIGGAIRSMDWKNALQRRYEKHYRLSACMENRQRIMLYVQDTVYIGYLLNMQSFVSAQTQAASQISLTFIVAEREFPEQNDTAIPGFLSNSGQVVTDKTVDDELFPQARADQYWLENRDAYVGGRLAEIDRKIAEQKKRIVALQDLNAGRAADVQVNTGGAAALGATLKNTATKALDAALEEDLDFDADGAYEELSEDILLHKIYIIAKDKAEQGLNLGIDASLAYLNYMRKNVAEAKHQWETSGDEIVKKGLKKAYDTVRTELEEAKRALKSRVGKMNREAERLIRLKNERDQLQATTA